MIAYGKTDVGRVRVSNQDAFLIEQLTDDTVLAVVCDGMGGANAGNVASELAARSIVDFVKRSFRASMSSDELGRLLCNSITSANIVVYDMSLSSPEFNGMGTTVVAAIASKEFTVIAHVGDSRIYLVSDEAVQLTRDHSVVQSLLESGKLTPEEAKVHPRKNVITRALGTDAEVLVDRDELGAIEEGQTLLLCTDGLSNYLENSELKEIIDNNTAERVVEVLVARANINGGRDNITAVTVQQKG